MSAAGGIAQLLEIALALAGAPLLLGWVDQWRARLQNRSAPPLIQPYRVLRKLFHKESVVADSASPLFRLAPYAKFGCMTLACAIVPTVSTDLPLATAADGIALVGLFALARTFLALAAMDIGTAFGGMGARRDMLIGFLAEPALLMTLFCVSLITHSTSLANMVETMNRRPFALEPEIDRTPYFRCRNRRFARLNGIAWNDDAHVRHDAHDGNILGRLVRGAVGTYRDPGMRAGNHHVEVCVAYGDADLIQVARR